VTAPDACLIVNPSAGGGRAAAMLDGAQAALAARGVTAQAQTTRDLDDARALALQAAVRGQTVLAFGGDGLIGAVAGALRGRPEALLGILPGGRGNDFARVLGIPRETEAACAVVAAGVVSELDLGEVAWGPAGEEQVRAFIGIASVGFDSDANRIANAAPPRLGRLVYAYGALRALATWRPARFTVALDGAPARAYTGYSVAAANSRAYGGGMLLAPDAELDDGQLDVVITAQMSRVRFLLSLPKVFDGRHVREPTVHVMRAREVAVTSDRPFTVYADGEPVAPLPARMRAHHRAIRVIVPASYARGR
jgi:YegS/Rv2252/BmrU family lipid kinase